MATTPQDSPGPGMRVGPFVLDVAAMGSRRRAPRVEDVPVEVPVPTPDPNETAEMPSLSSLSFLERRALMEAERQHEDVPPPLPDDVEEEVRGVLDDLIEEAAPVVPGTGRVRPSRGGEVGPQTSEVVRGVPAEARNWRRSPLTPRAETRLSRDSRRLPVAPSGRDGGVTERRDSVAPRGTGAPGTYRPAAQGVRPASSRDVIASSSGVGEVGRPAPGGGLGRSGATGTHAPASTRGGAGSRPSTAPRPTGTRVGPATDQASTMRTVGARAGWPPSGRYPVARASTVTVRRVAPARDSELPDVSRPTVGSTVRGGRDWTPARNVRDAQARVAAARASGTAVATPPLTRVAAPSTYTPREPQHQLRVRAAIMADRDACGAIDTTYTTDSVWQLDQRQDDNEIRIGLRQISLPKPMAATEPMDVPFVSHADTLWLVAEELEVPPTGRETTMPTVGTVVGFLTATIEPRREMVYLRAVAVSRDYRRQHLGSALVEHMRRWAAREGVPEVTADVSAKNAPALRLLQRCGFRFCGYSDRLYRNGEVALFLAMAVR